MNELQSENPLISIGMPIYNAGKFLREAVMSIVNQTYTNWELLIIDDGSTDASVETILDIHDPRIHIIKDSVNKGLANRLNETITMAKGRFFARMDQDDVALPDRFAMQIHKLLEDSKLDVVSTRVLTINGENKIVGGLPFVKDHQQICAQPWLGFYMPHPTWMGKIEWFRNNLYASPAPYFCEDQELLLRVYQSSKFASIDHVLLHYRVRDTLHFKKAFKTRLALLGCQLREFNIRKIFFSLLSLAVFILRVLKDIKAKIIELWHKR